MIIFYNKNTGEIAGTIEGRVHTEQQLRMWIGDKEEINRLIIQWKPTGKETINIVEEPIYEEYFDDEGFTETRQVGTKKRKTRNVDFEPDHSQKELFSKLDKKTSDIYKYRVDLKTKRLVKI